MPENFTKKTVRKLSKLHMYDCLRANKSLAAWGIEGSGCHFWIRSLWMLPMRINPQDKMINGERMEKWVVLEKPSRTCYPIALPGGRKNNFRMG